MPSALTVTRRRKKKEKEKENNGPFGTGPALRTNFAGNTHRGEGGPLFQLLQRPRPTTSNAVVVEGRPDDDRPRSRRNSRNSRNNVPLLVLSEGGVVSVENDGPRRRHINNVPLLVLPGGVASVQREEREEGENLAMLLFCGGCGVVILSIVGSYYWLSRKIESPGLSW